MTLASAGDVWSRSAAAQLAATKLRLVASPTVTGDK